MSLSERVCGTCVHRIPGRFRAEMVKDIVLIADGCEFMEEFVGVQQHTPACRRHEEEEPVFRSYSAPASLYRRRREASNLASGGDRDALQKREAEAVHVGQAPDDRPQVDEEVRQQAPQSEEEEA